MFIKNVNIDLSKIIDFEEIDKYKIYIFQDIRIFIIIIKSKI